MPKITLPQKQMTLEVEANSNLMDELLKAGLPVASSCHGDGICSMCRVKIEAIELLPAPLDFEANCLKRNKCEPNERLSCQITVNSDISVSTKYW